MLQWRCRTDKSSISQIGMVVNPQVICCSLFLLFLRQLVSHSIKHGDRFITMVQKPLHALQAVMCMVVLYSVDFARAMRRYVFGNLSTVQAVQLCNSFQVLVHRRTSSRAVRVEPSREKIPLSGIFQQFHTQRGGDINPLFFACFLLRFSSFFRRLRSFRLSFSSVCVARNRLAASSVKAAKPVCFRALTP